MLICAFLFAYDITVYDVTQFYLSYNFEENFSNGVDIYVTFKIE